MYFWRETAAPVGKIAAAAVPAIVRGVAAGERRVEPDDAGRTALIDPDTERIRIADAQAAKIEDFKRQALSGTNPAYTFKCIDVVIERRADKDADVEIVAARGFPVMEAMNKPLEARERQRAALSGFRNQAIPADVSARRVAQTQDQTPGHYLSGHRGSRYRHLHGSESGAESWRPLTPIRAYPKATQD